MPCRGLICNLPTFLLKTTKFSCGFISRDEREYYILYTCRCEAKYLKTLLWKRSNALKLLKTSQETWTSTWLKWEGHKGIHGREGQELHMICFVLVLKLEFVSFNGFVWSTFRAAKNHQKAYERLLISFDLFLTFFTDCSHIYVPNGMFWGSISRPHIGGLVMSSLLFSCPGQLNRWHCQSVSH